MIEWIKKIFDRSNDPVFNCELYKEAGCSHVDGPLCDFPYCSMLVECRDSKEGITINDDEQFHKELKELMQETKRNRSPVPFA